MKGPASMPAPSCRRTSGLLPTARACRALTFSVKRTACRHFLRSRKQIGFTAGLTKLACGHFAKRDLTFDLPACRIAAGNAARVGTAPCTAQITASTLEANKDPGWSVFGLGGGKLHIECCSQLTLCIASGRPPCQGCRTASTKEAASAGPAIGAQRRSAGARPRFCRAAARLTTSASCLPLPWLCGASRDARPDGTGSCSIGA